jgi:hypothetical protein
MLYLCFRNSCSESSAISKIQALIVMKLYHTFPFSSSFSAGVYPPNPLPDIDVRMRDVDPWPFGTWGAWDKIRVHDSHAKQQTKKKAFASCWVKTLLFAAVARLAAVARGGARASLQGRSRQLMSVRHHTKSRKRVRRLMLSHHHIDSFIADIHT